MSYWATCPQKLAAFRRGQLRAYVLHELDPEDPRPEGRIGRIVVAHRRYTIGDVSLNDAAAVREYWDNVYADTAFGIRWRTRREAFAAEVADLVVRLPIYGYDHSGLAVSLSPFSCPWDSGQLGEIYARRDLVSRNGVSPPTREQVIQRLRYEFGLWKAYIENDIYEFVIVDRDDEIIADGCGFVDEKEARRRAKQALAEHAKRLLRD